MTDLDPQWRRPIRHNAQVGAWELAAVGTECLSAAEVRGLDSVLRRHRLMGRLRIWTPDRLLPSDRASDASRPVERCLEGSE